MFTQAKEKKEGNFRSLTVTLAIAFLVLSMAVLIIASGLSVYFNIQTQQKVVSNQQSLIAQDAAGTVKSFFQDKFSLMEATVRFGDLVNVDHGKQRLALERLLGLEPSFRQLILLDPQKQELARSYRISTIMPDKFTEHVMADIFSQTGQGKTYISPTYIDNVTNEPLVIMAVPVTDVFGDFKGVLLAEVNLKFMWDLVGSIKVGKTGAAYVVDRKGNLIAFGDISRILKGENLIHLKEVTDFVNSTGVLGDSDAEISKGIQGNDVVANFVPLGTPDWAVVVEMPVEEAYADVYQLLKLTAWVILLCLVLTIALGILLSKRITEPVIKLRNAAMEIGKGDLDTIIDIRSEDEIGELASAFNKMTGELRSTTVSMQTLQTLLNSMPYGIFLIGKDRTIMKANRAALDMTGYESEDQITGQVCSKVMRAPDDDKCQIIELNHKADRSESVLITKDLRRIPILKTVVPVKLGLSDVFLEAFVDISERKKAEEAILESEERFRSVAQSAGDAIITSDSEGKIIFWNNGAKKIFGYEENEILGKPLAILMAERFRGTHLKGIERMNSGGEYHVVGKTVELVALRKDGSEFPMDLSLSTWKTGEKSFYSGILRDISERKMNEKIRSENERLVLSNRAKSEFLAAMSHELRTPLNAILGFSELLMKKGAGELNEKQQRYASNVITSGKHLLSIIDDILDLTRVESGKMEITVGEMSVQDSINECVNMINEMALKRKVTIKKQIKPGIGSIDTDELKFKQILNNLLSNAIKFSKPEGGVITITAEKDADMVKFSVSDTGIGIKEEDMGRLFHSFEQLESGITRKFGGTGLGLAISKKLVELLGGSILAESWSGVGSTFTFYLPQSAKKKQGT